MHPQQQLSTTATTSVMSSTTAKDATNADPGAPLRYPPCPTIATTTCHRPPTRQTAAVLPTPAYVSRGGRTVFAASAMPMRIPTESTTTRPASDSATALESGLAPPAWRRPIQIRAIKPNDTNTSESTVTTSAAAMMAAPRPRPVQQHGQQQQQHRNSSKAPFEDSFAPRNTWPRHGSSTTQRRRSSNNSSNNSNFRARSPLSIYGDGALHSFAVCGAPGCEVCTRDGTGYIGGIGHRGLQQSQSYDQLASADSSTHRLSAGSFFEVPSPVEKPGRKLIQHACENCRMPYIPKVDPEAAARKRAAAAERKQTAASSSWSMAAAPAATAAAAARWGIVLDAEKSHLFNGGGDSIALAETEAEVITAPPTPSLTPPPSAEGGATAAPAVADNSSSSRMSGSGNFQDYSRRLYGSCSISDDRSASAGAFSSSSVLGTEVTAEAAVGSRHDDFHDNDDEDEQALGFCSGDCQVSYMLTNPMAVRRQRAAAAAKAAARAAHAESARIHRARKERNLQQQQQQQQLQRQWAADVEETKASHARD